MLAVSSAATVDVRVITPSSHSISASFLHKFLSFNQHVVKSFQHVLSFNSALRYDFNMLVSKRSHFFVISMHAIISLGNLLVCRTPSFDLKFDPDFFVSDVSVFDCRCHFYSSML
jgi:hypothetical protein